MKQQRGTHAGGEFLLLQWELASGSMKIFRVFTVTGGLKFREREKLGDEC